MLDLFSGIGGFSLAARWTGRIDTAALCEIDPYCQKVLQKNFPGVPIHGDIRKLKGSDIGPVDIICGGFPCQPFSVAGKQRGTEDDRHLWPEMLRIVSDVRPTWVVGENVDGLVRMGVQLGVPQVASRNIERGPEFDHFRRIFTRQETMLLFSVLEDLEALGYGAVPLVIPACGVDAPHLRYRVWIVAYSARIFSGQEEQRAVRERTRKCREQSDVSHPERDGRGSRRAECEGHQRQIAPVCAGGPDAIRNPIGGGCGRESRGGARTILADGHPRMEDQDVSDADRAGCREQRGTVAGTAEQPTPEQPCRWLPEPAVCRVAHGVPNRVDRLKGLGNAIVPQVAYEILMAILAAERESLMTARQKVAGGEESLK